MRHASFLASCALGMMLASGVDAGGFVAPVEPASASAVQTGPASDWSGAYAGGSLGFAFGGDDVIGLDRYLGDTLIGTARDLGRVDVEGPTAGLHLGYRWQHDRWVIGPELWIEGGSVDARDTVSLGGAIDVESSLNHLIGLHLKAGYAAGAQTLVYGTAGAVRGDLDYALSDETGTETVNYDASGYSLGLGVERRMHDNLSVFAEWQYRNLGTTEITVGNKAASLQTRATPEHHNLKLGVNFSF